MQEMEVLRETLFKKHDKHADMISDHGQKISVLESKVESLDSKVDDICYQLQKTETRVTEKQNSTNDKLDILIADFNQMVGAMAGKKESRDYFMELIKILPILAAILGALYMSHK